MIHYYFVNIAQREFIQGDNYSMNIKINIFKNIIGHTKTILNHKKLVRELCFKAGLYRQGIMHDWSKYSPLEFWTGVIYYQDGKRSPNAAEKEKYGFSKAWLHHKGRNKHHFEYWIDFDSNDFTKLIGMEMDLRYVIEMFCDRVAASKNYYPDSYNDGLPLQYYNAHKKYYVMNEKTADLLFKLLSMLEKKGEEETFRYIRFLLGKNHSITLGSRRKNGGSDEKLKKIYF